MADLVLPDNIRREQAWRAEIAKLVSTIHDKGFDVNLATFAQFESAQSMHVQAAPSNLGIVMRFQAAAQELLADDADKPDYLGVGCDVNDTSLDAYLVSLQSCLETMIARLKELGF